MIDIRLNDEDFLAAQKLHSTRQWIGFAIVFPFGAILYETWERRHLPSVLYATILYFVSLTFSSIAMAVMFLLVLPFKSRKAFEQAKAMQRPYRLSRNSEYLHSESANSNVDTPWTDFRKWRDNSKLFVIYVTDRQFRLIPKRAFADPNTVEQFRTLLTEKIGPAGKKR